MRRTIVIAVAMLALLIIAVRAAKQEGRCLKDPRTNRAREKFSRLQVKEVNSFPDLKVEIVESFPNSAGKWQIVDSFPDYKIEMVESFPDFTVEFVKSFPGPAK